ncbi:SDR family oxidoreductase [Labilibacter sediminis]|nr:SDR family oxidoreductase [Labilibacter sediminis]
MKTRNAIITGATSGLGKAYALLLAKEGWNLLITGRQRKKLHELKTHLEQTYRIHVIVIVAELNNTNEFNALLQSIQKLNSVDLLINNAGFGCRNGFFKADFNDQQKMLQVHVTASTKLIYTVVPKMVKNNGGAIINVSSLSAFLPSTLNYFYCSTKAFLVSFTECLHMDLNSKNIKVQALCPGFIKTHFHDRIAEVNKPKSGFAKFLWMQADDVARYSLKKLQKHSVICIPGLINKVLYFLLHFIPRRAYYVLMTHFAAHKNIKEDTFKHGQLAIANV